MTALPADPGRFEPRRVLVVSPHGDDATLFAGGTIAAWSARGVPVTVVRVTQDEKDSLDAGPSATIEVNAREFLAAMEALGAAEAVSLGFRDCELVDVPYGRLRERLIREIRRVRPDLIVGFDPRGLVDDENPDHGVVARASADAAWAAGYPNFHPEHAREGLAPHAPAGCWFFTRDLVNGDTVVDIGPTLERKLRALERHETMLRSALVADQRRIAAAGLRVPSIEALGPDDYAAYWRALLTAAARMAAAGTGFEFAERFRSTVLTTDDPLVSFLLGGALG